MNPPFYIAEAWHSSIICDGLLATSCCSNNLTGDECLPRKVLNIHVCVVCKILQAGFDGLICYPSIHQGNKTLQHLGNRKFDVGHLHTWQTLLLCNLKND